MKTLPSSLIVLGGGVIGSEYAAMFAALGCDVWMVDRHTKIMSYLDGEVNTCLLNEMEKMGVRLLLGREYQSVSRTGKREGQVITDRGETLKADAILFALGRVPCVEPLHLERAGVALRHDETIQVDDTFRTSVDHLYAAGDVIGFPALASTSTEQGRVAARYAMGYTVRDHRPEYFPFAIYTIPETSMMGATEEQLVSQGIRYEKGIARYEEIAKATIKGGSNGMLKLLFDPQSWKLLGIHVVGDQAAELIHIGQAVMSLGGRVDYFVHNVFNYPTWAEAYRVAALDGLSKLKVSSRVNGDE